MPCCVKIFAKIGLGSFMSQVTKNRKPLPIIFIEISSKRIKVGIAFVFHGLVDVTAPFHTSNIIQAKSLNLVELFLACLPT